MIFDDEKTLLIIEYLITKITNIHSYCTRMVYLSVSEINVASKETSILDKSWMGEHAVISKQLSLAVRIIVSCQSKLL